MSSVLNPKEIVRNIHIAELQADDLRREADRLDASASNHRRAASTRIEDGFAKTSRDLVDAWKSGEFSDVELLRTQLELRELDPKQIRRDSDPSTDMSLARFAMLTPGEFVLGLGSLRFKEKYATGIISQPPTDFCINPGIYQANGERIIHNQYSPTATFDITVKNLNDDGSSVENTFELNSVSMNLGLVGRKAIEHAIGESDFTTTTEGDVVNPHFILMTYNEIVDLRSQIAMLYRMGMDEIDTENIDKSIKDFQQTKYYKAMQNPNRYRLYNLLRGLGSPRLWKG